MKIKKKFAFLSLVLTAMLLAGCGGGHREESASKTSSDTTSSSVTSSDTSSETSSQTSSETSSETSSSEQSSEDSSEESSSSQAQQFTVTFYVDDQVVQTGQVEEGDLAVYEGEAPTKTASGDVVKYRFKGWDRDLTQPITADTEIHAVFAEYVAELVVDTFEGYDDTASLIDEGWEAQGYDNTAGWTTNTKAAVSLGLNPAAGAKSLRFDTWGNGVGYKAVKHIANPYDKSANALQFSLMTPSINSVTVLLNLGPVTIQGQTVSPVFKYRLNPTSGEYVQYTIPFDDDAWLLWDQATSIKAAASYTGIHQDDITNYLTGIEFYIQGNDGISGQPQISFVDDIKFVTLDNPALNEVEKMGQYNRYTGVLADGESIVKIDINNDLSATAKVINLETPVEIPGAVALEGKQMTFTSADGGASLVYKANLVNGGQSMKFVSASGAMATTLGELDLTAVQVVDNFDQYTSDGKAYYQGNTDKSQRSGARGAYYSEYYSGSGSADFGGSGWSLLGGDGSQLKLKQDGGHSGNNYLCMKNSQYNAMRYMTWGFIDGTSEQNAFRGEKLGFWAKTNGKVPSIKVSVYSQTAPRNATKDNSVRSATFTQTAAIGEWTHFEVELNPKLVYYGYCIFMEKNNTADSYLYIDDVEVYGANPYAVYEAPPANVELPTSLTFNAKVLGGLVNAHLRVNSDGTVALTAPAVNMSVAGTYTSELQEVTFAFGDTRYVATVDEDFTKLTFKSVSGSDLVAQALNNVSFDIIPGFENAETYSESGKMYYQSSGEDARSGARGAFYCDYYSGSGSSPVGGSGWSLMGGNGDQLSLDNTTAVDGTNSIKIKKSTAGSMRFMQWDLYKGTAKPITGVSKFVVYLKNPESVATKVNIMVYRVQQVTPSNQGADYRAQSGEFELPANTDWTPYEVTLDPTKTYYGFCLLTKTVNSSTGYINFDAAHYVKSGEDASLYANAVNNLTLNGTIVPGAASLKFGTDGKIYFTCAGAGADNVEGTFSMRLLDATTQELTVTVANTTIKGTYAVALNGQVTFTVTNVTGDLAAYVAVDTVFSNN